jgi:hypothetical protein
MNILMSIPNVVYSISEIIAIIAGIIIFVVVIYSISFNTTSGSLTLIGSGFVLAILLACLALAPFIFRVDNKGFKFPTSTYWIKFWVIYFLEIVVGGFFLLSAIFEEDNPKKFLPILFFIGFIIVAPIGAAWTGLALEEMIFVYSASTFNLLSKILLEIAGVIYLLVYFLAPIILYLSLISLYPNTQGKKTNITTES